MDKYTQALGKAIAFASRIHAGQFDKSGQPYILHPLWVMQRARHFGADHAILGVSHDTWEDGFGGDFDLAEKTFRAEVIDDDELVIDMRLLTHDPAVPYMEYIKNTMTRPRPPRIKKLDLKHNSDITRLKGVTDKDIARMRKYHAAFLYLDGKHDKLLDSFA